MTLAKPLNTEPLLDVVSKPAQVSWWQHEMWDAYELVFGHDRAVATCLSYAWEDIQDVDSEEWHFSTKTWQPSLACFPRDQCSKQCWVGWGPFCSGSSRKASLADLSASCWLLICLASFWCIQTFSAAAAKSTFGLLALWSTTQTWFSLISLAPSLSSPLSS